MKISELVQAALDKHYGNANQRGKEEYLCHAMSKVNVSRPMLSRAQAEVIDYIQEKSPSDHDTIMGHLRCDDPVYAKIIGYTGEGTFYSHDTDKALAYRVEFIKRMIASFKERGI